MTATFDIIAHCSSLSKSGSEHAHQRAFFGWLNHMHRTGVHPYACAAFAVPNGGLRDIVAAARLKHEGVKAGVPDIVYPVPCGAYHSLYLEMKVAGGSVSKEQKVWHESLRHHGHACAVVWSWLDAVAAFSAYENGDTVAEEYK